MACGRKIILAVILQLLPLQGLLAQQEEEKNTELQGASEEVKTFIERRDLCDHWLGEEPYDEERQQFLLEKMKQDCTGTDNELARLRGKYKKNSSVMQLLSKYEEKVEPSFISSSVPENSPTPPTKNLSLLDYFKLLPLESFDNTTEGLSPEDKLKILGKQLDGGWILKEEKKDKLVIECKTPTSIVTITSSDKHKEGVVLKVATQNEQAQAVQYWKLSSDKSTFTLVD